MQRLLEHFAGLISEVLDLAVKIPKTDAHLDGAAAVRDNLLKQVQAAKAAARQELRADRDVNLATDAIVAWIDEVMLGYPEWGTVVPNLQGEISNTQVARETFFSNLEQLGEQDDEVREVFHLLLCLGFQGYYGELATGQKELDRLKDLHGQQLASPPLPLAKLNEEYLTAQPYSVAPLPPLKPKPPPPQPRQPVESVAEPLPWRLILGACALALCLLLLAGLMLLPSWLKRQVERQVASIDCSLIDVEVGIGRTVSLSGFVSSDAAKKDLFEGLNGLFGLAGIRDDLAVYPSPFCTLLIDAWPYVLSNEDEDLGASIGLAAPSQPLKEGDLVVVDAAAPAFDGHLYIFYVNSEGDTVPLLPNKSLRGTKHRASERISLGGSDSEQRWKAAPPFGTDMLLLYASSEPLLSEPPRDYYDDVNFFADKIRQGLDNISKAGGQAAASFSFLETIP